MLPNSDGLLPRARWYGNRRLLRHLLCGQNRDLRTRQQLLEVAIESHQMFTAMQYTAAASQASGMAFPVNFFSRHSDRRNSHSDPEAGISTPDIASKISMNAMASAIGVG